MKELSRDELKNVGFSIVSVSDALDEDTSKYLIDPYSDELVVNNSNGCFFQIIDRYGSYDLFKKNSISIDDEHSKFYLGYFPLGKLNINTNKLLFQAFSQNKFIVTGRAYKIGNRILQEFEYEGKRYVKNNDEFIEVLPIEWIIFTKTQKIYSYRILRPDLGYYEESAKDFFIQDPYYDKDGKLCITNDLLKVENGILKAFSGTNNSFFQNQKVDTLFVPDGVIAINLPLSAYKKTCALKFASSVESFTFGGVGSNEIELQTLELYDNTTTFNWKGKFNVSDKIIIHYRDFSLLKSFINIFKNHIVLSKKRLFKKNTLFVICGEQLKGHERAEIVRLLGYRNVKFNVEENYEHVKNKNSSPTNISESDESEKLNNNSNEQEIISELRNKCLKYFEYYSDEIKEQKIADFNKKNEEYNSEISSLIDRFDHISIDNTEKRRIKDEARQKYESYVHYLKDTLDDLFSNDEYIKMIDFLNSCISILRFEDVEINYSLLKKIKEYADKICKLNKNEQEFVLGKLIAKIVSEKQKIGNKIDNPQSTNLEYATIDDFEQYLSNSLEEEFKLIDDYLFAKKEISKTQNEVTDIFLGNLKKAKNEWTGFQIEYMNTICLSIDAAIAKNSQFKKYEPIKKAIGELYNTSEIMKDLNEYVDSLIVIISRLNLNDKTIEKIKTDFLNVKSKLNLPFYSTENEFLDLTIEKLNYTIYALNLLETYMYEEAEMSKEIAGLISK